MFNIFKPTTPLHHVLFYIFAILLPLGEIYSQGLPIGKVKEVIDEHSVSLLSSNSLAINDPGVEIGKDSAAGLDFSRTWLGGGFSLSRRWTNNHIYKAEQALIYNPETYSNDIGQIVTIGTRSIIFLEDGQGGWIPKNRNGEQLEKNGWHYIFTDRDGTVYDLPPNGPHTITRPNGHKLFVQSGSLTSNSGFQLKFSGDIFSQFYGDDWPSLTESGGSVKAINNTIDYCSADATPCSSLTQTWPTTSYSWSGDTLSVTSPTGELRTFTFDGEYGTILSRRSGGAGTSLIEYEYLDPFLYICCAPTVASVKDGAGIWEYESVTGEGFVRTSPSGKIRKTGSSEAGLRKVVDELGNETIYIYDQYDRLTHVVPPEGTWAETAPWYEDLPVGGYTENEYDGRGNVTKVTRVPKSGSGLPNFTYMAGYSSACTNAKTCNQPLWIKDAKGNQTDYTYSATHGGVLTEMKPAPTLGAARPLTVTTYLQRSAWIKNSSGQLVQSLDPIWMVATITECETAPASTVPVCGESSPQTVTTNEYGSSGSSESLYVKGVAISSGSTTLRTCYGYDIYGRRISETKPASNLGACP